MSDAAALHPGGSVLPIRMQPPGAAGHVTAKAAILPFACWRVDDLRFELDSSIVRPDAKEALASLAKLVTEHTSPAGERPPLTVFGHADPLGQDDYNKGLSGRRATAVYALLARRPDLWESLWSKPGGGDAWNDRGALPLFLGALGYGHDQAERKRFQKDQGLAVDGDLGPASRAALFKAYMDHLSPMTFAATDFLGRGQDPAGKADYQGCGELNPAVLVGTDEVKAMGGGAKGKAALVAENQANRRVMVFLFRPGTRIDPTRWPCPRAGEGLAGCNKRLWSDGEARRTASAARRRFTETKDTFACRFYHRLADRSPCEGVLAARRVQARLYDEQGRFVPGAPFRVISGDEVRAGVADTRGCAEARFAPGGPDVVTIQWGPGPATAAPAADAALPWTCEMRVEVALDDGEASVIERLRHLGYSKGATLQENVHAFQWDNRTRFGLVVDGVLGTKTRSAIRTVHDGCPDDLAEGS